MRPIFGGGSGTTYPQVPAGRAVVAPPTAGWTTQPPRYFGGTSAPAATRTSTPQYQAIAYASVPDGYAAAAFSREVAGSEQIALISASLGPAGGVAGQRAGLALYGPDGVVAFTLEADEIRATAYPLDYSSVDTEWGVVGRGTMRMWVRYGSTGICVSDSGLDGTWSAPLLSRAAIEGAIGVVSDIGPMIVGGATGYPGLGTACALLSWEDA